MTRAETFHHVDALLLELGHVNPENLVNPVKLISDITTVSVILLTRYEAAGKMRRV